MIPRIATYRVQFRGGMDFARAAALVPHLARLGASHLYASPVLAAAPGSTHGYDITDFNTVEPALGGEDGLRALSAALRRAGMGLMLDIVPNHMAAHPANAWWRDAAEWGARAAHARHFDIDWSRRLTLPFLGGSFDAALAAGDIALRRDPEGRGLVLAYHDHAYPLTPPSYRLLAGAGRCGPLALVVQAAKAARCDDAAAFHDAMRAVLDDPATAAALDAELARTTTDRARVSRLHDAQPWVFTDWRSARHDLSYRRFFEVTGLAGTRVEDPAVFDDAHRLVLRLLDEGVADGLRVDHVDGLTDPAAYLRRLRDAAGPDAWIVVEKILEGSETLPRTWPVEGTTGYEFIAAMSDLLLPARGSAAMEEAYGTVAETLPAAARRQTAKRRIVTHNLAGELDRVVGLLAQDAAADADAEALREALVALVVGLPVYRTYGDARGFSDADRAVLDEAASLAADATDRRALAAVLDGLARPGAAEARARFQQLTGPAMAKAVEDTLFYRHTALLGFNEVGCDPVIPPASTADVHAALAARRLRHPWGLTATATHDTKRGEDARTRLYALAEAPADWAAAVARWRRANAGAVRDAAPEPATEWWLYQALAGIWPAVRPGADALATLSERFTGYVVKALREAKLRTDWTDTDDAYERAVCGYARHLLDPANAEFEADFHATLAPFAAAGAIGSLTQTLVKAAAPGVPDIYQGTEGGDFSLVDPDNRRPPDWDRLAGLVSAGDWPPHPEAAKALLLRRVLAARRRDPDLFAEGDYRALTVRGARADALLAFARCQGDRVAVVLAPIRPLALHREGAGFWRDTAVALPAGATGLRSVLSGRSHPGGMIGLADWLSGPASHVPVDMLTGRAG